VPIMRPAVEVQGLKESRSTPASLSNELILKEKIQIKS